jgi:hypothetical protein
VTKLTAAILAAFAGAMCFAAGAGADSPFHLVRSTGDFAIRSDGVRFAFIPSRSHVAERPWVVDTLRGRSFRPAPPVPGCTAPVFGAGRVLWLCPGPDTSFLDRPWITNLATGASRKPAGWDRVQALESESSHCSPGAIGRYWLEFTCGGTLGPESDPYYLNHHTGALTPVPRPPAYPDLGYAGLVRPVCAPLKVDPYVDLYAPPFVLDPDWSSAVTIEGRTVGAIRLRRCGHKRAELLSRCRLGCLAYQLGNRYATWGDGDSAVAYLPRPRRRVVLRRPREAFDWLTLTTVVHTCNRVFAQWGDRVFVARVKSRWGAPRCPTLPPDAP